MHMEMSRMRAPEVAASISRRAVAIVPVGSTEQHGPHLPVCTDSRIVYHVAVEAAKITEDVVTPGILIGYNQKELSFAGTISLQLDTLSSVLYDVGKSLIKTGFETVLFLNGHGWNKPSMSTAVHKLAEDTTAICAAASYYDLIADVAASIRKSEFPGGMSHAGEFETSIALHLFPDDVDMDSAVKEISFPRTEFTWLDIVRPSKVSLPRKFSELSKSGVIGDPLVASEDKGKVLVLAAIDAVVKLSSSLKGYRPT